MPALFVFLLKVNIALLLFCAGYYLVLTHLTFYTLNRIYLVMAILFATIYPKINLSGFVEQHEQIAKPVQAIAINWQAPAEKLVSPFAQPNYWYWVEVVFWIGAALLALRLLMQVFSLYKLYRNSTAAQIYDHEVRVINSDAGPFSFWKSIYINPARHEAADLKAILLHEQVHINEWHTLDILLAELSTIFYWFNPGVWLMKKAIRENIEFITDRKILKSGIDSKQYQYSLVSVSFASSSNTIVNHFNISTIKKRIIMMNAKRSSKAKLTRYAFLVPAVIVLLLIFTVSKAAFIKRNAPNLKTIVGGIKIPGFTPIEKTPQLNKPAPALIKANKRHITDTLIYAKASLTKQADTNVKVKVSGSGAVSVISKHGADTPIYKIRANGKKIKPMSFTVINGNLTYIDTVKYDTIRAVNGHIVLDTIHIGKKPATIQLWSSNKFTPRSNLTFATASFGNSFSLNHLSDKLIIINGRIATEADLKKLSAFDIDRMLLKTDEETKELYGDKAKNGILFIVTKKK